MLNLQERTAAMIERYGEAVKQTAAAKIIMCSPNTIRNMLNDGRLERACQGERVDVYSIARYICAPAQNDLEARRKKRGNLCKYYV